MRKFKSRKLGALVLTLALMMSVFLPSTVSAAAKESESRQNDYPIVLCHGFNGWGRNEAFGRLAFNAKYYWGGNVDLQEELNDRGFTTYTAAVGPLSSNWDRACELYAEIKGGTVDYGAAHAKRYGHARFGRTYKGFDPKWGKEDEDGNIQKVHLIGHSQGGQTVRVLSALLGEGSEEERAASGENVSPLFKGGHGWVDSVTTLASPHDGTTLGDIKGTSKIATVAFAALGSNLGSLSHADEVYDCKLDQFGLKRNSGESMKSFLNRVIHSSMWTNSKDNATYDLGTDGAVTLNKWVSAQPDTYYFSWACQGTKKAFLSLNGHQIADPLIMGDKKLYNAQWAAQAAFMGSYHRKDYSREIPVIDEKWWPNDGYVNTISESGPHYSTEDVIEDYDGSPKIGQWNFMGTKNIDHEDIIGRNWDGALDFFEQTATMLSELPK